MRNAVALLLLRLSRVIFGRFLFVAGLASVAVLTSAPAAAQAPFSIWSSAVVPQGAALDVGAVEVGLRFRSDVNGFIVGIRFYKNATNGGTHVGNLWTNGGTLLASATFTAEAASGWQLVTFTTPVAIVANTTYVASYHTNVGHYAANDDYFAAAGVNNAPLHALQDGVDGPSGVYRYGAMSGFPSQTYHSTNYWIDVLFSTSSGTVTTPVTVNSITPAANATGVSPTTVVTATFNAMMNASTVNSTTFTLSDPSGNQVPAQAGAGGETPTSTLTPLSALVSGTRYTATVKGGPSGVKDMAGSAMATDFSWSFTTSGTPPAPPTCPCSIWSTSTTNAVGPDSDASAVELGVRFRSDTAGFVTGVRFFKAATNTGTHTGSLWNATGTLLANATFTSESGSGWQQVLFATPVAIGANTTYVASYHTTVGHYSANDSYFASSTFDHAPLHALADGVDGPNGLYHYGSSSAFPSDTYHSANYWVDVVFDTTSAGDTTPPTVTSVSPPAGGTMNIAGVITVTFSEKMSPGTLNASTIQLRDAAGNVVPVNVFPDGNALTVTVVPNPVLAYLTTYTATVTGGAGGVKDLAGNPMAGNITWSFTTGASAPPPLPMCPCSLWNASSPPPSGPDSDSSPVELGLRFRSDFAGFITGMRFFQFGTNTGTHSGSLWSNTSTLLATATFSQNESGAGWQQLTFPVPVAITADTTYVASYHTNVGHYAANTNYFVAGFDNPPLHALADGVDGASGVYRYGDTSGFPDQTYLATNYWVDVVFSNAPAADPPTIASVTPAGGAAAVSPTAFVTATFSKSMNPATINATTMQLYTAAGTFIPSTVTYSIPNGTAILQPTSALARGTTYSAVVIGGVVGPSVTDVGGTTMTSAFWWSFTTAP
jgi:hypothetical protein